MIRSQYHSTWFSLSLISLLAACANMPPAVADEAATGFCTRSTRGKVLDCVSQPRPSAEVIAQIKRFEPDPQAFTVYLVRANWADARQVVSISPEPGVLIQTVPQSVVRLRLPAGAHTLTLLNGMEPVSLRLDGRAGEQRFVGIDGLVTAFGARFAWSPDNQAQLREQAQRSHVVADWEKRVEQTDRPDSV